MTTRASGTLWANERLSSNCDSDRYPSELKVLLAKAPRVLPKSSQDFCCIAVSVLKNDARERTEFRQMLQLSLQARCQDIQPIYPVLTDVIHQNRCRLPSAIGRHSASAGMACVKEERHMDQDPVESCSAGAGSRQPGLRVPPRGEQLRHDVAVATCQREQAACQRLAPGVCWGVAV